MTIIASTISPGPAAYATTNYNIYLKEPPAYTLKERFQSTEYISVEESLSKFFLFSQNQFFVSLIINNII